MSKQPLISIIIPVYNTEKYLCKCIDSVLAQTYQNLEIILVDDGSTDNSGQICNEYAQKDARVKVIHQQNSGLSAARNEGIRISAGSFLSFIDSDDWVAQEFIETLYEAITRWHMQIACVSYCTVTKQGCQIRHVLSRNKKEEMVSSIKALEMGFLSLNFFACNKLFAQSLFEGITFPKGQLYEDMPTISKVFLKTKYIVIIDKPLYYYNRLNLSSITRSSFSVKKLDYFKATDNILKYAYSVNNKSLIYVIKQERAYHIAGFFRQMIEAHFNDMSVIKPLQKELRCNIGKLWTSSHKITNKLFALACCINFNLAAQIYRRIFKR